MAAHRAGFTPRLVALHTKNEQIDVGYASVDRVRSFGRDYRSEYAVLYSRPYAPGIAKHLKDKPGPHLIHSFGGWAIPAAAATRKLRRQGVDVIHVTSCYEFLVPHTKSKLSNAVVRAHPLKYLRQRAVYDWVRLAEAPLEGKAMDDSDAVVVNYERLRRMIHEERGQEINVVNLPYAAPAAFDPIEPEYDMPVPLAAIGDQPGPLIVSTSRHAARKGVDVLIHALARLRDEGVAFRAALVGPGNILDLHRALVRELGLEDRVVLPGRVPDVRPYLHHADIFALPSLAEGSGSVSVLEALQFGVPIVSSAVDGMVEDLTDDVDGLLVETGSVDDLYRALKRLVGDAAMRARLGKAGAALYERRFSAEAATTALADFYAGLGVVPTGEPVSAA
jgi:glycosyltransferase involved in cell wall biosynthesis